MRHGKVEVDGDLTLASGATANEISTDGTLTGDSDTAIPTEKAVKTYTDSLVNGLDWKNSCRLGSDQNSNWTTSVTAAFSAGTLTLASLTAGSSRGLIDVVEPVDGDRILIKDAGAVLSGTGKDDKYNGIWEVTGGTTTTLTLTRTTDADEDAEVTANLAVFIEEGSVNADAGYTLTTEDPITVDTTAQIYTQFTAGGGGDVTSGSNITDNRVVRGDGGVKGIQESTTTISDDGEMVNTSQPAFNILNTAAQNNIAVTTNVTVVLDLERFDVGANFASNIFTAPVTGKYQLNAHVSFTNMDSAASDYQVKLVTSNRTYFNRFDPRQFAGDVAGVIILNISHLADMDIGDTAFLQVRQVGGSAQTDIAGGSARFSGILIA